MKQLIHQTQPTGSTCVCTCIAMLVGKPAGEIISDFHGHFYNVTDNGTRLSIMDILQSLGVSARRAPPDEEDRLNPGAVYLLTVPSINVPASFHEVVLDYRNPENPLVLDPAKGYGNRKYYTANTDEVDDVANAIHLLTWRIDAIVEHIE